MGMFVVLEEMRSSRSTGHVDLAKGAFVFLEFPFAEEAQRSHAEGEDRWDVGGSGKERRGVQNCAVAAESRCHVDLLREKRVVGVCVDGERYRRFDG